MAKVASLLLALFGLAACERQSPLENSAAIKVAYELQERCGETARKWFAGDLKSYDSKKNIINHSNHYNAKLNKCFGVLSVVALKGDKRSFFLEDLLENKSVGAYIGTERPDKMEVDLCTVGEKQCKSEREWADLTKPYMND